MDMDPEAEFSERRGSYTALAAGSPPQRSAGLFFLEDCLEENPHHFLDVCTLCMKALHPNRDIYMYRGDWAFCSEECRKEQIEMDEAMEQNRNLSSSFKTTKKASVQVPEYPRQD